MTRSDLEMGGVFIGLYNNKFITLSYRFAEYGYKDIIKLDYNELPSRGNFRYDMNPLTPAFPFYIVDILEILPLNVKFFDNMSYKQIYEYLGEKYPEFII